MTKPMSDDQVRTLTDDSIRNLMMAMVTRGQKATRQGDAESAAVFQSAYDFYRAEAVRRGLVR